MFFWIVLTAWQTMEQPVNGLIFSEKYISHFPLHFPFHLFSADELKGKNHSYSREEASVCEIWELIGSSVL